MEIDQVGEDQKHQQPKEAEDCTNPNVVTKYQTAAGLVNEALQLVVASAQPGMRVVELCELGDQFIENNLAKVYKDKKVSKGVAFPTCISVNNLVGHFSPLHDDNTVLVVGDLVKVDLGAQIDGYVAVGAHSFVLNGGMPIEGRQADVLMAAYVARECAIRLIRPGNKNTQLTQMFEHVAKLFNCVPVSGIVSHEISRFNLDGEKCILNRNVPEDDIKVPEVEFAPGDAYAIEIVMATGKGRPSPTECRTTVFKRSAASHYQLKLKISRAVFGEITAKFPHYPFTMRAMADEKRARAGINECLNHGLLEGYRVLAEKQGEFVAHFKTTVVVLPSGTLAITGLPVDASKFLTQGQLSDDIKLLLSQGMFSNRSSAAKKKRNKKKNKDKAGNEQDVDMDVGGGVEPSMDVDG